MSEFNLDPEAINRYVAEKIAESSIGAALKEAIDKEVKRLSDSYNNPMQPVVAVAIAEAARDYLASDGVKERLRAAVETALTDEAIDTLISKIISESWRR